MAILARKATAHFGTETVNNTYSFPVVAIAPIVDNFPNTKQLRFATRLKRNSALLEELRRTIGRTLQEAEHDRHNVIIRPRSTTATVIQLDDLDAEKANRIAPHAFMVIRTSPGMGCRGYRAGRFRADDCGRVPVLTRPRAGPPG